MVYSDEIEDKIDQIMLELKHCYPNLINYRWYALKLLEGDTPMQSCWSPAKKILNPVIAKKFCARIATGDYDAVTTSLLTLPESTAARCGILPMPVQRNARNRSLRKKKTQLNENRVCQQVVATRNNEKNFCEGDELRDGAQLSPQ